MRPCSPEDASPSHEFDESSFVPVATVPRYTYRRLHIQERLRRRARKKKLIFKSTSPRTRTTLTVSALRNWSTGEVLRRRKVEALESIAHTFALVLAEL